MKIYELSKIPGIGNQPPKEPDYEAIYASGYSAGYEDGYASVPCYENQYLTIEVISGGTLYYGKLGTRGYYRLNGGEWVSAREGEDRSINVVPGDKIEFKSGDDHGYSLAKLFSGVSMPEEYIVYGNLLSVSWADDFIGKTTFNGVGSGFASFFEGCTGLTDASNLIMPPYVAEMNACYDKMFKGCSNLRYGPALPATTLQLNGYREMFRDCSSLVSAPELPAETLGSSCYMGMFQGCTSLVSAPALPATTLTYDCYGNMFSGCTSLVNAPALPAAELAEMCYYHMFDGCTSLTTAPYLGSTTLARSCYTSMFERCSGLVNVQDALPATVLDRSCYGRMFEGCTSLVKAPELPTTTYEGTEASHPYSDMFKNCSSLNYVKCMLLNNDEEPIYLGEGWISGSNAGTFVKHPEATWRLNSTGGVPRGWTVVDAS